MARSDLGDGDLACFKNPVAFDITDADGNKLAGAGQRRSKYGLLHQGSVVAGSEAPELFSLLVRHMAIDHCEFTPEEELLYSAKQLAGIRYASDLWLNKR